MIWNNPIISSWRDGVIAKGGDALLTGYPYAPHKGEPTAVYYPQGIAGPRQYELAPWYVRILVTGAKADDKVIIAAGKGAEKAEEIVRSTGLDKGLSGVVAKVTGVPHSVLVVGVLLGGIVIGYAALVNVGLLPPIRKVFK